MSLARVDFDTQLDVVLQRDEEDFIWFHPRSASVPCPSGGDPRVLITLQKHLQVSDHYSGLHVMWSGDLGRTWRGPDLPAELDWRNESDEVMVSVADVTPGWHPQSGRCVGLGTKIRYNASGEQLLDRQGSHETAYAAYDPGTDRWTPWRMLALPHSDTTFFLNGSGCSQWLVEPDGNLLVPVYHTHAAGARYAVTVLRCAFVADELACTERGGELRLDVERGLCEPSLVAFGGRYYLTLRNDERGYVTVSADGLQFEPIRPWLFDDGEELGSYNTQQHWLAHVNGLFLVYTRRGAANDHVIRHRAPLFIAQVDPDKLCVVRDTERILIPESGVPLGNFGAARINEHESWVTVSEFMWPTWNDAARKQGAAGRTFVARVAWRTPNE